MYWYVLAWGTAVDNTNFNLLDLIFALAILALLLLIGGLP